MFPDRSGQGGRQRGGRAQRGAATAEVAVVLPAVIALLALLLTGATAGVMQLQLEKAAQAAVRQLGRGEPEANVGATVRKIAGDAAQFSASRNSGWISVRVTALVPGPWAELGGWSLAAEATAPAEPSSTVGAGTAAFGVLRAG